MTQESQSETKNDTVPEEALNHRSQGPILTKGQRILGHKVVGGFNNQSIDYGVQISEKDSLDVHKNLDVQDELIKDAQNAPKHSYGIRTEYNAKVVYDLIQSKKLWEDFQKSGLDFYIPDVSSAEVLEPARSNLVTMNLLRYSPETLKCYDDHTFKNLYRREPNGHFRIGKEVPRDQPIITHEFIWDCLVDIAEKHKEEFELMEDHTYEDRKGYRRYFGVLSKRLDRDIQDSFRIGDTVRIGAMVRNGIAENMSVGFDLWTYAVTCQNGSIGRNKELGSQAWKHIGKADLLKNDIYEGLNEMVSVGEEFVWYYEQANLIQFTQDHLKKIYESANIADKYFNEKYFEIVRKEGKGRKVEDILLAQKDISLWEGYNALTQSLWHTEDLSFDRKASTLRKLNNELVAIVKATKP
jgi:hypothetical protein